MQITGHARAMGRSVDELQYKQTRAKEKSAGSAGRPQLVR